MLRVLVAEANMVFNISFLDRHATQNINFRAPCWIGQKEIRNKTNEFRP
jgi:hypothetical protein